MNAYAEALIAVAAVVGGFVISVMASRRAVSNTAELTAGTSIPPFVVGFTLLALGTDLPEIATSVIASLTGDGDLVVGDAIGSVATQTTLVLGLLPLAGGALVLSKSRVLRIGIATVFALLLGVGLMRDGDVTRLDATILIVAFLVGTVITWGPPPAGTQMELSLEAAKKIRKTLVVLLALAVVGGATTAAVWGLTTLSEVLAVPEYIVAFFLASLGTSLPELVVTTTAMRSQQTELAIGDAMGASFIDSTLAIGIGPLFAPIAVTADLVIPGSLAAAAAVGTVALVLAVRGRHDRKTGAALLLLYLGFYILLFNV